MLLCEEMKYCPICQDTISFSRKTLTCSIKCRNTLISRRSAKNPERIAKISAAKMGELNPNWAGDNVKYGQLHSWVKKRFKKPSKCVRCSEQPYDLANKGMYNRNLENWEWLCRKCHMKGDGRLNKLKKRIILLNKTRKYDS